MTEYTTRLNKIEDILSNSLPQSATLSWQSDLFGELPSCVQPHHIAPLITPCNELVSLGGKRWRPLLLVLCAECAVAMRDSSQNLQVDNTLLQDAYKLTPLVEFVHTASLIHDDIEDSSSTRRGKPSAYISWGIDTAINSASWLYFTASKCIDNTSLPESDKLFLYQTYTTELRRLHLGQAMDIAWHKDNSLWPTPQEYKAMVLFKTGTLASLAAITGVIAGGGTKESALKAGKIAGDIGIAFQMLDDVINITTGNPGKKRGDDIVEGKKSLPFLLHIVSHPEDKSQIAAFFSKAHSDGINSPSVENCIALLNADDTNQSLSQSESLINTSCNDFCSLFQNVSSSHLVKELFLSMFTKTNGVKS